MTTALLHPLDVFEWDGSFHALWNTLTVMLVTIHTNYPNYFPAGGKKKEVLIWQAAYFKVNNVQW